MEPEALALTLPIRRLVEFLLRTGSIDSRFTGFDRANEGARIHRKLQRAAVKEHADYAAEVFLRGIFAYEEIEFTVGGIPREYDDLVGWTAFDDFMEDVDAETEVSVHGEAYLYGGEETVTATPEEVAYLMMRMERDENFLAGHCDNIEAVDFSFLRSPDEYYGMEMN